MINRIKRLADNFRCAIIKCNKDILPETLKKFPLGSCGDASLLLGRYLKENDIYSTYYISGVKMINLDNGFIRRSHAWLEYNDLVIDITANQFDEIDDYVIVSKNKNWYSRFKIRDKHIADYNNYDPRTVKTLDRAYENIILYL